MTLPIKHIDKYLSQDCPVYLFSGENQHFIKNAIDKVLKKYTPSDNQAIIRFYIDSKSFDWASLSLQTTHPSLFEEKTIIYIKLTITLDKSQQTRLLDTLNHATNSLLIIETSKLTPAQSKQPWIQWIEKNGQHYQSQALNNKDLLQWIRSELQQNGLSTTDEGYRLIALSTEGNMLALSQTLEQLFLIFSKEEITLSDLKACLSKQPQYNIFQCVDEAFNQNTARMLTIFESLKQSHTEPTLLLWALLKELRTLTSMKNEHDKGKNIPTLLKQYHIWSAKTQAFTHMLQSHPLSQCYTFFQHAKRIDEMIKGLINGNVWFELKSLLTALSSPQHQTNT